jgi:hypothetical protein
MKDSVRQVGLPVDSIGGAGELAFLLKGRQEPVSWWKPSIGSAIAASPVAWLAGAFAGACLILGWIVVLPFAGVFGFVLFKVALIGVAILISLRSRALRRVLDARRELFCIHCGYSLKGLEEEPDCPECGMVFRRSIIEDYRRDPDWFIKRFETLRKR